MKRDAGICSMAFDAVYILGGSCIEKDIEFKYSLRSLEKYMKHLNNVFLIGRKPVYLNDKIIHIPHQDIYKNKARNIMEKIRRASLDTRVSDDFVFLNDDYFFTKPFDPYQLPYYYKQMLQHTAQINPGEYGNHVKETLDALRLKGHKLKNFDTHKPIIYNKAKVKKVIDEYVWNKPFGYVFKSLYCNTLKIEGVFKADYKVAHPCLKEQWRKIASNTDDMFSIGDRAVNISLKSFFEEFYPEKSSFEL